MTEIPRLSCLPVPPQHRRVVRRLVASHIDLSLPCRATRTSHYSLLVLKNIMRLCGRSVTYSGYGMVCGRYLSSRFPEKTLMLGSSSLKYSLSKPGELILYTISKMRQEFGSPLLDAHTTVERIRDINVRLRHPGRELPRIVETRPSETKC